MRNFKKTLGFVVFQMILGGFSLYFMFDAFCYLDNATPDAFLWHDFLFSIRKNIISNSDKFTLLVLKKFDFEIFSFFTALYFSVITVFWIYMHKLFFYLFVKSLRLRKAKIIPDIHSYRYFEEEKRDEESLKEKISALKKIVNFSYLLEADFLFWFLSAILFSVMFVVNHAVVKFPDVLLCFLLAIIVKFIFVIFMNDSSINERLKQLEQRYDSRFCHKDYSKGSARWQTSNELNENISINNNGLVVAYDKDLKEYISIPENDISFRHLLFVAPSGAGKSRTYVFPNVAKKRNASVVVTDPSGELFNNLATQVENPLVLQPFDPDNSLCWNPLYNVNSMSDAKQIAKAVMENLYTESKDQFWKNSASNLMACFIYALKLCDEKLDRQDDETFKGFPNVIKLLALANRNMEELDSFIKDLDDGGLSDTFASFSGNKSAESLSGILSTLMTGLELYDDEKIKIVSSNHSFDFSELRKKNSTLFIIVPELKIKYCSPYITLFYQQLFEYLSDMSNPDNEKNPIYIFFDEFGNQGKVYDFSTYLTTVRKRKVSCSIIVQDMEQIVNTYGQNDARTIVNGCSSKLVLGGSGMDDCEKVSKLLGEFTLREEHQSVGSSDNTSENSRENGSSVSNSKGSNVSYSYSSTSRKLMTPQEIRGMSTDKAVFISGNISPAVVDMKIWDRSVAQKMIFNRKCQSVSLKALDI